MFNVGALKLLAIIAFPAIILPASEGASEVSACGNAVADIMFVLDDSGSISKKDFLVMKTFVKKLVSTFPISSNAVQVGIITFSTNVKNQFNLNKFRNILDLNTAIDRIAHIGGWTHTYAALNYLKDSSFTAMSGDRKDVLNIAVVITDGNSNNQVLTVKAAEKINSEEKSLPVNYKEFSATYSVGWITVTTEWGLKVMFDGRHRVTVTLPPIFADQLTGICGDCNGEKDDFRTKSGEDVSQKANKFSLIGASYQVEDDSDKPETKCKVNDVNSTCSKEDTKECDLMKDKIFEACIEKIGASHLEEYLSLVESMSVVITMILRTTTLFSVESLKVLLQNAKVWEFSLIGEEYHNAVNEEIISADCKTKKICKPGNEIVTEDITPCGENSHCRIQRGKYACINSEEKSLPVNYEEFSATYSVGWITVTTIWGLKVMFDGRHRVTVTLQPIFADQLTGICGDCNGQKDDFRTKSGEDVSQKANKFSLIGASYQVEDDSDKPETKCKVNDVNSTCSKEETKECDLMKDKIFEACIEKIGASHLEEYLESCRVDVNEEIISADCKTKKICKPGNEIVTEDITPCGENSHCRIERGKYACVCNENFILHKGKCVHTDACHGGPCRNGATCLKVGRDFQCICAPGFRGKTCSEKEKSLPVNYKEFSATYSVGWITVTTKWGLKIMFDCRHRVTVTLPPIFADQLTGICGDCNGEKDDFRTKSGEDVSQKANKFSLIGASYQVEDDSDKPETKCKVNDVNSTCSKEQTKECDFMNDKIFEACIEKIGASHLEEYLESCRIDVCSYHNDPTNSYSVFCRIIEGFATECESVGIFVNEEIISADCKTKKICKPGNEIVTEDITPCGENSHCGIERGKYACICNDNFILHKGKCVHTGE
ncbi:transmembrane cell adhesion receptor mua-3-like [Octopus vulgaris]|uniref:Transmembrane cell adhesion receptor mua-3-like n=1 Tax=Octopus vulgaris TaxID=6645 RepID=A0AA36EZK6_OCTVU|nr:transmembrane cell adhesion receptor mua-3-like [Octopus vulgaris]